MNLQIDVFCSPVKSRNLLNFGENGGGEESLPSGLGGEYPEWKVQSNIMATWPQEQRQHGHKQAESQPSEPHTPTAQTNGTNTQSLTDQQAHR